MDDTFFLTVHQCGTDIPAQFAYLPDGEKGRVPGSARHDFRKTGEQFHPYEKRADRTISLESKIFYSDYIGGSAQCLHDLNFAAKGIRNIAETIVLPVEGHIHRAHPAADLDDLQRRIHPNSVIISVNMIDITESTPAQTINDMPFRPDRP